MPQRPTERLRIGSWPGPSSNYNSFIQLFCQSLVDAGVTVIDVSDPRRIRPSEIDVLHIHWPEMIFWPGGSLARVSARLMACFALISRLKLSGVRIVWTVHNLKPHDLEKRYARLWTICRESMCALTDGFVTLSPATLEVVSEEMRGLSTKPGIYAWHPAYPQLDSPSSRREFREQIGLSAETKTFAFLGLIRPYKGVEELIGAFRETPGDIALIIAGAAIREDYGVKISELANRDPRIHLMLRRLSEQEFSACSSAADVIVLPFRESLHSGSLVHAISHHRVALTPATPFSLSLKETVGAGWVQTYTSPLTSEILLSATEPKEALSLDALSTSISGPRIADFYRQLVKTRRPNVSVQAELSPRR